MVYHITNYMKESNVWLIRKTRWILWSLIGFVPMYRNTYWDFHAGRVVWGKKIFDHGTEEEQIADAIKEKANWGYKPRYEPVYEHSIKKRKHALQTREEQIYDTPRLLKTANHDKLKGYTEPKDVRILTMIAGEHNREPGAFDYEAPQDFYSTFPDVDYPAYVTLTPDGFGPSGKFNHSPY